MLIHWTIILDLGGVELLDLPNLKESMDFNQQVLQVPLGGKLVVKVSMLTKTKNKINFRYFVLSKYGKIDTLFESIMIDLQIYLS